MIAVNSKLVRLTSVSNSALGPYVLQETVLPRFAHEVSQHSLIFNYGQQEQFKPHSLS